MINDTIAHYKITAKLGQGGMGAVYRATDTKLDREVAIKVLPGEFAQHPERLARFEREAKALAKLNHPNIGSIYGFDQHEGLWFLVLELIEGEDLSERLKRGPLPVEEALKVFQQIAEALEAAHDKGIVHRDLKPGNVKVDSQGRVKVLDFGLAKARLSSGESVDSSASRADSMSPTITSEFTMPGKVMGTAAYMSPEQSRGQEVDKRTDVWAFGCCLYEALTGRRPFKGATTSDLLADILKSEPDFTVIPPETPSEVLTLLRRCLEKDLRRRLRDLGDIAITLEETSSPSRTGMYSAPSTTGISAANQSATPRRNWVWPITAALGAALVVAGFFLWRGDVTRKRSTTIRALAVLPFENLKQDDSESQYLATTLQTALKEQLGALRGLDIKAHGAVDVDATVQGTFVRVEDSYRVSVMMTDAAQSETVLGTYSSPVTNIFPLQDRIAVAVAEKLGGRLTDHERGEIKTRSNVKSDAYIAYRKGLDYLDARQFDEARDSLRRAIELDDRMDEARVYLLTANFVENIYGGTSQDPGSPFREFKKELATLPPDRRDNLLFQPGIHNTTLYYDRNWKRFRELTLDYAQSRHSTGSQTSELELLDSKGAFYAIIEGRLDELLANQYKAMELDPDRLIYKQDLVFFWWMFGRYDEALKQMTMLQERFDVQGEDFTWILLANNRLPQAKSMAERVLTQRPQNIMARCNLAAVQIALGNVQEANNILADLENRKGSGIHVPYLFIALPYGMLGDFESAFRHLREGVAKGQGDFSILCMRIVPMLELFSKKPEYWTLVDQLDFPPLPPEHPYYEVEQRMRYGQVPDSTVSMTSTNTPPKTVGVLPMEPLGNWVDTDGLSDGLTLALNEGLQKIKGLKVPGWASSMAFKGATNLLSAGHALQVDHLLVGRVARAGDQLRFDLSLDPTEGGSPLWSTNFVRKQSDIFALQSEIAQQVATALQVTLGVEERQDLDRKVTDNPEAYDLYLKGRAAWNKRTIPDFERAIEFYNQALEKDTNFALAYSGLAAVHAVWPIYLGDETLKHIEEAHRNAYKAAGMDAMLAEPHAVLGYLRSLFDWDWKTAEREYQAALRIDPGSALGYHWYSELLRIYGQIAEALQMAEQAVLLDPSPANLGSYAALLMESGHTDSFTTKIEEWIKRDPEYETYYELVFEAHVRSKSFSEAKQTLERYAQTQTIKLGLSGGRPESLAIAAWYRLFEARLLALQGNKTAARELLGIIPEFKPHRQRRASVLWAIGDEEATLHLLEEIISEPEYAWDFIHNIQQWKHLHGDRRFRAILRKLNLDRYYPDPTAPDNP